MKTILIIEDNHDVRENIAEILELSGYNALQAKDGKEGVSVAMNERPDLILCDVMMPHLDGFGVLKILSTDLNFVDTPFIFLTAKADNIDFRKGMGLGASDYITKPFDDTDLLVAIETRLKQREKVSKALTKTTLSSFGSNSLANKKLRDLVDKCEKRKFKAKDIIYEYGKNPIYLHYVDSGIIKCCIQNDLDKELISNFYAKLDYFGLSALILGNTYSEKTVAMTDSTVTLIPTKDIEALLLQESDIAIAFLKMMARQRVAEQSQLIDLAYSSVRKRVANGLLTLLDKIEGNKIAIGREDLAQIAGTAKETVIRTLSDFKTEKIIILKQKYIEVINIEALAKMIQ